MRRASFSRWSTAWPLSLVVGACSNLIGLSGYEIDPRLDAARGGTSASGSSSGGTSGSDVAGEAGAGGAVEGGAGSGGREPLGGEAGSAGEPPVGLGCQNDAACDDTIDCTVDSCLPSGECEHSADSERCDAANCETCTLGIGCVAGPKQVVQLLGDPKFDEAVSGWTQDSDGGPRILPSALSLSSPNVLQLGPAADDATDLEYSDIYQTLRVPAGSVALTLSLSYQFARGVLAPQDEYAVIAVYRRNATDPFAEFHQFKGSAADQATWKQVTYSAPFEEVQSMVGKDLTFDLVAHSADGVYLFDNLQLDATLCQ